MVEQEQIQEETQANEEDKTPEEQIVTAELAEKLGVSKTLVGKPIDELGKSLRELQTDYARTKSTLKEIQSQKQKEVERPNLKAPDPLNFEKDEDYQRAYDAYLDNKVNERLQPLIQAQHQQQLKAVMDTIQSELPKGMNLDEVANEWMEASNVTNADLPHLNLNMVKNSIVSFAKSKKLNEIEAFLEKDTGDLALSKIRASLKNQPKDFDLNSVERTKPEQDTVVQRILKRQLAEQKME